VSSGLLCERKTLLKNPGHLTGIENVIFMTVIAIWLCAA
jgi:hypothetical protein